MGKSVALLLFLVTSETAFSHSTDQDEIALAKAMNQFALDIHKKLATEDDGNILLSPLGISTVFGMLHYGSRGRTAQEIRTACGYEKEGLSDKKVHAAFKNIIKTFSKVSENKEQELRLDNAVFNQKGYPILPEYNDGLLQNYNSNTLYWDFQNERDKAVEFINECVKNDTNNQIEKSLDDVDPSTIMILLNDMYLKATWKTEFDAKYTTEVFYNKGLESEQTEVPMMHLVGELPYMQYGDGCLVILPYKGEDISLGLYFPNAMKGAYKAEQKFESNAALEALKQAKKVKLHLVLPKFKLQYGTASLNTELQKLGIKKVFENRADLRGISGERQIAASDVLHKMAVEVTAKYTEASEFTGGTIETRKQDGRNKIAPNADNEGSEGGRVTGMETATRMEGKIKKIVFNRPFLVGIFNKKKRLIYFQGRVSVL